MRLTVAMINHIVEKEEERIYKKKTSELESQIVKLIEAQVKKDAPYVPKELMDGRYIRVSSLIDWEKQHNYGQGLPRRLVSSYPCPISVSGFIPRESDALKQAIVALKSLNAEKSKFASNLRRIIETNRSDKKLLEVIPELKQYLLGDIHQSTALVPMGQIKEVRSTIIKGELT